MADFLLEIGLEEVPARMLARAQVELGERVQALLERERLLTTGAETATYSTPRRLAVLVREVAAKQTDAEEVLTGPAWAVAFKAGAPTPAAHAFAKKACVAVDQLQPITTAKGEYVSARVLRPGRNAATLLAELLPQEIGALSWPKPMYWRAGKPERFVRPVQWLVALLDQEVVPLSFAGVAAGRETHGHRVLHGVEAVAVASPGAYVETLRSVHVMADVEARRHRIRKELDRVTRTVSSARWREDEALVDTVTHLTEWPSVVLGSFAPEYLALPEEVLVTVMRDHQKYFAVEDKQGKLLPHFLTVLNTVTDERGEAIIRHGNERVLRARFSDARFFWDFDQKIPLAERVAMLEKVTFQKDLGSYRVKTERTRAIAAKLAEVAQRNGTMVDAAVLDRAAELAKTDLTTELVKEFTELQGIVGGLYARAQELDKAAQAMYWQYLPASITDPTPPTIEGQILGLADRIGTIVDLFDKGLAPSGSRDPYALRRAANGVIKILAASQLPLSLQQTIDSTRSDPSAVSPSTVSVRAFLLERLGYYLREVCAAPTDVVNAVLATEIETIPDAQARAEALAQVRGSEDFAAIASAWKRTKNILRQAGEKHIAIAPVVESARLVEPAEQALWNAMQELLPAVARFRMERNYAGALAEVATLRPHVDRFFEETMVLVEDENLRANRLALLQAIVQELGRIADFSELGAVSATANA